MIPTCRLCGSKHWAHEPHKLTAEPKRSVTKVGKPVTKLPASVTKLGRPRQWSSNAERQRAYRARKQVE